VDHSRFNGYAPIPLPAKANSFLGDFSMSYKKGSEKPYRNKQTLLPPLKRRNSAVKNAIAKAKAKIPPPLQPVVQPRNPSTTDIGVLHRDGDGYYARFGSKSNPSAKPYVTRIWEIRTGRFVPGDVSCNCPGYNYNHKCHHTEDIQRLLRQESAAGNLSRLPS